MTGNIFNEHSTREPPDNPIQKSRGGGVCAVSAELPIVVKIMRQPVDDGDENKTDEKAYSAQPAREAQWSDRAGPILARPRKSQKGRLSP